MVTKQAVKTAEVEAAELEFVDPLPSVHIMVRVIAEPPKVGSYTGEQVDQHLAWWKDQGYRIAHANSEIKTVAAAVPTFEAVMLFVLEKDVA